MENRNSEIQTKIKNVINTFGTKILRYVKPSLFIISKNNIVKDIIQNANKNMYLENLRITGMGRHNGNLTYSFITNLNVDNINNLKDNFDVLKGIKNELDNLPELSPENFKKYTNELFLYLLYEEFKGYLLTDDDAKLLYNGNGGKTRRRSHHKQKKGKKKSYTKKR